MNELLHYLDHEIKQSKERMTEYGTMFDGVQVDNKTRIALLESHIRFCENIQRICLRGDT